MKKNLKITVNGTTYDVVVEEQDSESNGTNDANSQPIIKSISQTPIKEDNAHSNETFGSKKIEAPMPGTILSINVTKGQTVKKGEILLVLEAMKMENEIVSPIDGKVISINVKPGDNVNSGEILISLD